MQHDRRNKPLLVVLSLLLSCAEAQAIDWNWPNNMIPSDQKAIDKAYSAYQEGDVDTALILLNGIKGAQNNDCRARHILSEIYLEQKRYGEAKRELQEMYQVELALDKANTAKIGWVDLAGVKLEIADAHLMEGSVPEALNLYRELQQEKPTWVAPRFRIGSAYEMSGDHEAARNQYKSILESGIAMTYADRQGIESRLADVEKRMGSRTPAANQSSSNQAHVPPSNQHPSNQPINHPPNHPRSLSSSPLGDGHQQNSPDVMTNVSSRLLRNDGTNVSSGPVEDAVADIRNKKYNEAIDRLKDVLARQPKNGQVYYLLGIAYASTRRYGLARDAYEKTLTYGDLALQKLATIGLTKLPKVASEASNQ